MSEDFIPADASPDTYGDIDPDDGPVSSALRNGHCRVCGIALEYAGRGRKPSYCSDHKPSGQNTKAPKPTASKASNGNKLRRDLLDTFNGVGMFAASVDKFDGAVIIASAPRLAETLATMAEHYPQFRKFLEDGNKSVVWLQLTLAVMGLVVPIAAHHGLIPVEEREAYTRFHGDPNVVRPA